MLTATIIDWLDEHSGASTALLTLALVAVTIYYAVQNQRMVAEMRRTRNAAILPRLGLEFHHLGPNLMEVAVKNVGPGPALAVDVQLRFEPLDDEAAADERRIRQNVLVPGEQLIFAPPGELQGNSVTLPKTYSRIRLTGTMRDAGGEERSVNETFDDLAGWSELLENAHRLWRSPEPEKRLATELHAKFKDPIAHVHKELHGIGQAIARLQPPPAPDNERRPDSL